MTALANNTTYTITVSLNDTTAIRDISTCVPIPTPTIDATPCFTTAYPTITGTTDNPPLNSTDTFVVKFNNITYSTAAGNLTFDPTDPTKWSFKVTTYLKKGNYTIVADRNGVKTTKTLCSDMPAFTENTSLYWTVPAKYSTTTAKSGGVVEVDIDGNPLYVQTATIPYHNRIVLCFGMVGGVEKYVGYIGNMSGYAFTVDSDTSTNIKVTKAIVPTNKAINLIDDTYLNIADWYFESPEVNRYTKKNKNITRYVYGMFINNYNDTSYTHNGNTAFNHYTYGIGKTSPFVVGDETGATWATRAMKSPKPGFAPIASRELHMDTTSTKTIQRRTTATGTYSTAKIINSIAPGTIIPLVEFKVSETGNDIPTMLIPKAISNTTFKYGTVMTYTEAAQALNITYDMSGAEQLRYTL